MSETIQRTLRCRTCHRKVEQIQEKAIGSGEYAVVWANLDGEWVCHITGNEHEPNHDRERRPT